MAVKQIRRDKIIKFPNENLQSWKTRIEEIKEKHLSVEIYTLRGQAKKVLCEGPVQNIYERFFTIFDEGRTFSISYSDLITKSYLINF